MHLRFLALLLCFASTTHAQSVEFGPLRFGMTFNEIRAAMPEAGWTDVPPTGGVAQDEIEAKGVLSFAGMPFDANVFQGPDNRYRISFKREEPAANAAACEAKSIALVAELEKTVGSFGWSAKTMTGEHLIQVGNGSTIMVQGWTQRMQLVPRDKYAAASTTGFGMRARSALGEGDDRIDMNVKANLDDGVCSLQFLLRRNVVW